MRNESKGWKSVLLTVFLAVLAIFFYPDFFGADEFLYASFIFLMRPLRCRIPETFVGLRNYWNGIEKVGFFRLRLLGVYHRFFGSGNRTVHCHDRLVFDRIKTRTANALYYLFVFSMIVPFQMVMFTMSKMANLLRLDNPLGIILLYLGFGPGCRCFYIAGSSNPFRWMWKRRL